MMRWLDRVTGLVTMYRLVLICLLALAIEAILVSMTSQLAYSPLGILVGGIIVMAVTYLSNRLFAALFRVRPHSESALITGLILLFLFTPLLDPASLGALALAGFLAMASKYLLAVRGRHIFNPAALGAFVTSLLLPNDFPGWWVGNPWLLPLVAVAAFIILYRTRHLTMGVLFVVVGALSITLTLVSFGESFGAAIGTAFVSYPVIYFAGFMLSEPLTLPPRRWQQLALAVIVGALFGLTFHLGPVIWSYQLVLLIGNLLAFLVGQRRGIRLDYLGREPLDSTSWELSFTPRKPLRFAAGQFMELSLPHAKADVRGLRRTFSIASAPRSGVVSFGIRTAAQSSTFKSALLALEPGDTVTATAIGGDFVLPRNAATPILLIAGGIGITPYMSHLAELEASGGERDVVLVYATSDADDLAYSSKLDAGGHRVLLVAPSAPAALPATWTYLGAGPLSAELLREAVPDAAGRRAYISGPPGLVRSLKPALRGAGVRRVTSDYFIGY